MGMRRTILLLAAITTAWLFARSERDRTLYRLLQRELRRRSVLGTAPNPGEVVFLAATAGALAPPRPGRRAGRRCNLRPNS
jgi:hypothetical protein